MLIDMAGLRIFVLNNDEVVGPYSEFELEQKLSANEFQSPMIWWRGLSEWLTADQWRHHLKELQAKTLAKAERLWKVRVKGHECPPMSQKQMIQTLKDQADLNDVKIWTEGYEDWRDVYQIIPIIEELGVSRRKYPRVPLSGSATIEITGTAHEASPLTVSEGGIGVSTKAPLAIGQRVMITIRSPQLYLNITTSAEVVFVNSKGLAGLRFEGLSSESRAAIIEYAKRFKA